MAPILLERADYPDFAHPVAQGVEDKQIGNGRAYLWQRQWCKYDSQPGTMEYVLPLCWNAEIAALARQHNDANIIALPARFISEQEAEKCVDVFFSTPFEGGRHTDRVTKN